VVNLALLGVGLLFAYHLATQAYDMATRRIETLIGGTRRSGVEPEKKESQEESP
jgi:hypothetical protein